MPADSTFFNKIVPIILVAIAAFTAIVVVLAVGVLLGLIPV
jgi:hypothetical protein